MTTKEKQARRERAAALLNEALGTNWRAKLAEALELDPSVVRRYFAPPKARDDAPPVAVLALAEFLNATPRDDWPARWR